MTDNQLFEAIITTLLPQITATYPTAVIVPKQQPTQQGIPTAPTIFYEKLFDSRYGWIGESLNMAPVEDPISDPIPQDFTQLIETTIQFSALVLQNPADLTIPTASDLLHAVAMLLSVDVILQALRALGANVERITQVRNPYFVDDQARFEAHPSFDVILQHQRDLSLTVNQIQSVNSGIYPV